ncbi:hypothetical protein [Deinococcus yavapaiensis]|nr:hypothetical protein [Deinococcus yavapaiensis]
MTRAPRGDQLCKEARMARLKGKGNNTGTSIAITVLILLILFLLLYFFYLKPNNLLDLGF